MTTTTRDESKTVQSWACALPWIERCQVEIQTGRFTGNIGSIMKVNQDLKAVLKSSFRPSYVGGHLLRRVSRHLHGWHGV